MDANYCKISTTSSNLCKGSLFTSHIAWCDTRTYTMLVLDVIHESINSVHYNNNIIICMVLVSWVRFHCLYCFNFGQNTQFYISMKSWESSKWECFSGLHEAWRNHITQNRSTWTLNPFITLHFCNFPTYLCKPLCIQYYYHAYICDTYYEHIHLIKQILIRSYVQDLLKNEKSWKISLIPIFLRKTSWKFRVTNTHK